MKSILERYLEEKTSTAVDNIKAVIDGADIGDLDFDVLNNLNSDAIKRIVAYAAEKDGEDKLLSIIKRCYVNAPDEVIEKFKNLLEGVTVDDCLPLLTERRKRNARQKKKEAKKQAEREAAKQNAEADATDSSDETSDDAEDTTSDDTSADTTSTEGDADATEDKKSIASKFKEKISNIISKIKSIFSKGAEEGKTNSDVQQDVAAAVNDETKDIDDAEEKAEVANSVINSDDAPEDLDKVVEVKPESGETVTKELDPETADAKVESPEGKSSEETSEEAKTEEDTAKQGVILFNDKAYKGLFSSLALKIGVAEIDGEDIKFTGDLNADKLNSITPEMITSVIEEMHKLHDEKHSDYKNDVPANADAIKDKCVKNDKGVSGITSFSFVKEDKNMEKIANAIGHAFYPDDYTIEDAKESKSKGDTSKSGLTNTVLRAFGAKIGVYDTNSKQYRYKGQKLYDAVVSKEKEISNLLTAFFDENWESDDPAYNLNDPKFKKIRADKSLSGILYDLVESSGADEDIDNATGDAVMAAAIYSAGVQTKKLKISPKDFSTSRSIEQYAHMYETLGKALVFESSQFLSQSIKATDKVKDVDKLGDLMKGVFQNQENEGDGMKNIGSVDDRMQIDAAKGAYGILSDTEKAKAKSNGLDKVKDKKEAAKFAKMFPKSYKVCYNKLNAAFENGIKAQQKEEMEAVEPKEFVNPITGARETRKGRMVGGMKKLVNSKGFKLLDKFMHSSHVEFDLLTCGIFAALAISKALANKNGKGGGIAGIKKFFAKSGAKMRDLAKAAMKAAKTEEMLKRSEAMADNDQLITGYKFKDYQSDMAALSSAYEKAAAALDELEKEEANVEAEKEKAKTEEGENANSEEKAKTEEGEKDEETAKADEQKTEEGGEETAEGGEEAKTGEGGEEAENVEGEAKSEGEAAESTEGGETAEGEESSESAEGDESSEDEDEDKDKDSQKAESFLDFYKQYKLNKLNEADEEKPAEGDAAAKTDGESSGTDQKKEGANQEIDKDTKADIEKAKKKPVEIVTAAYQFTLNYITKLINIFADRDQLARQYQVGYYVTMNEANSEQKREEKPQEEKSEEKAEGQSQEGNAQQNQDGGNAEAASSEAKPNEGGADANKAEGSAEDKPKENASYINQSIDPLMFESFLDFVKALTEAEEEKSGNDANAQAANSDGAEKTEGGAEGGQGAQKPAEDEAKPEGEAAPAEGGDNKEQAAATPGEIIITPLKFKGKSAWVAPVSQEMPGMNVIRNDAFEVGKVFAQFNKVMTSNGGDKIQDSELALKTPKLNNKTAEFANGLKQIGALVSEGSKSEWDKEVSLIGGVVKGLVALYDGATKANKKPADIAKAINSGIQGLQTKVTGTEIKLDPAKHAEIEKAMKGGITTVPFGPEPTISSKLADKLKQFGKGVANDLKQSGATATQGAKDAAAKGKNAVNKTTKKPENKPAEQQNQNGGEAAQQQNSGEANTSQEAAK